DFCSFADAPLLHRQGIEQGEPINAIFPCNDIANAAAGGLRWVEPSTHQGATHVAADCPQQEVPNLPRPELAAGRPERCRCAVLPEARLGGRPGTWRPRFASVDVDPCDA